jgi:hypothetical protein
MAKFLSMGYQECDNVPIHTCTMDSLQCVLMSTLTTSASKYRLQITDYRLQITDHKIAPQRKLPGRHD